MQKIEAVIFDMDGILLDTESICMECWARAGEELGYDGIIPVYRSCIGCNTKTIIEKLSDAYPALSSEKIHEFHERTRELFHVVEDEKGIALMEGVPQILESLKNAGFRLAVASSTRWEAVSRQLTRAGLISYFEVIITGDTVAHSKPAPDIYLKTCSALGLPVQACVAIEDSPNGVRSATSAGLRCIVVPDQIVPDEEIKNLAWKICDSLLDVKITEWE